MFSVSVVDHVRLSFGHVAQNYTIHARAAERLATLELKARITILILLAVATSASVLSLFLGRSYQIAAAVTAGFALAGYTIYVATNIETRLHEHRSLAHRLWLMCERYRSLLAEIQDGLLDDAAILARRETLIQQVHTIYEQGFPLDRQAFENADQQVDQYLPASTRKGARMPAAGASAP